MTLNKQTVEMYLESFRRTDRQVILSCLTDDIEWDIPGTFQVRGKPKFDAHIVDDAFLPNPAIAVTRARQPGDHANSLD